MFSPYHEVLAQSRMDQLYGVEIPAAELRLRAHAGVEEPQFRQATLLRLARRVLGSIRRPRAAAPAARVIPAE